LVIGTFTVVFKFEIVAVDKKARVGKLTTPHGVVETPAFLPVGTQATVKSLDGRDIREIGGQMVLANTYHLFFL
jgi:queuine tRNA-ribosyltransferase